MAPDLVGVELHRIRKELVVLALAGRLWPLEQRDADLQDDLRAREAVLQAH